MTTEEAFLRSICEGITDALRRFAFADWLDERGDPRGEWLRVGCELETVGLKEQRRKTLEARQRELEQTHPDILTAWERRFALARIKDKVRRAPTSHWLYDKSATHNGRLNPVLSEDDVAAFEREHRVTLPEEYRTFLLEVGNGGLGPGDGLSPLPVPLAGTPTGTVEGDLDKPFSLTFRSWDGEERFESESGVLYLATPDDPWGSAYLIVTGEDRGLVWGFGHIHGGWCPQAPTYSDDHAATVDCLPRSFFRWYEDWLDVLLSSEDAGSD
jgi:uncharacterized protein (TIGR02996 family)